MSVRFYITLVCLSLGIMGMPLAVHAAQCSNTSLRGAYGFQAPGPQDNSIPPLFFETVGTMVFDGAGSGVSTGVFARSDGDVNSLDNHTFTYAVAPTCRFTFTWDDSETYAGVIADSGEQLFFIETSGACCGSAIIRRGEAVRVAVGSASATGAAVACSNRALKGTFGFTSTVTQNNGIPPRFLELAGFFQFDGVGKASTSFDFAQSDGDVSQAGASLIYNVAPDCTFTMTQDNGESYAGVIVQGAQGLYFIETTGACCGSAIIRRGRASKTRSDR